MPVEGIYLQPFQVLLCFYFCNIDVVDSFECVHKSIILFIKRSGKLSNENSIIWHILSFIKIQELICTIINESAGQVIEDVIEMLSSHTYSLIWMFMNLPPQY
ncbi:hypothetical protein R5R35_010960 [Gryllus longicercus]|uniref:Uncharacterized protein n=1 Tax=Gryllus longicercus TaxID=2509291 RepID=A0AAN9Z4X9_9ORTH